MRFTITPLGSAGGRTVGQVVGDVVRYLEPRGSDRSRSAPEPAQGAGPSSYYADRGTEPGRWLGHGAREAGLTGAVSPDDFAAVLAGRDPSTGDRLITARGSAGRRPTLGAGNVTRLADDGVALYDVADAAAALGVSKRDAEAMIAAGERIAFGRLLVTMEGADGSTHEPDAAYVVPRIDADGSRWVTAAELDRVLDARSMGVPPDEIARGGEPNDLLSLTHAARLAGVTARYLRRLCRRYDDHQSEIEESLANGRTPKSAFVVGRRGTNGKWYVHRNELVAFLERRVAPAVRIGYDLTLTTEKSLGVLAMLGDDDTRRRVLSAIQVGNDRGLQHIEYRAASARAKGKPIGIRGWTVASFRHLTSRALDPFPHHHNVVANTVVDEHDVRRALDARALYWTAQEASAIATAAMRHALTRSLGVRWRPGRTGGWEIEGISDDVVREFSRRRQDIEDAVAELEEAIGRSTSLDEVQDMIARTRPEKQEVDPRELVDGWWARARSHGLTPSDLAAVTGRSLQRSDVDRDLLFERLADPASGLCSQSSIFTRADAMAALVDAAVPVGEGEPEQPLIIRAEELDRLTDEFLASGHVVPLHPASNLPRALAAHGELFSTREILDVQRRILDRFESQEETKAVVDEVALLHVLDEHPELSDEQTKLVTSFCRSGRSVQCAIGRAGAGKTTSMRAAADAWQSQGWRVVGAAVKGEAARHLAVGAEVRTETLAWFLARRDRASLPLDDRTVLIIDEASTVSDRDLDVILSVAGERGAAVRLIGDPAQHGAVGSGGMFRHLCERNPDHTPELRMSHRLRDPIERSAVESLRHGEIDEAMAALEEAGRLHVADDDLGLYVGMLQRWWAAHLDGDDHPMVDRRHHTRQQLNRLARQLLRTHGELGTAELVSTSDRRFSVGDRVVARMAARHLHVPDEPDRYVRNGASGTVVDVVEGRVRAGDRLRIDFEGIGAIDVPRQFVDEHAGTGGRRDVGIDHAYAVTSYAVQGATFETSTSRIDDHASRAETYVDLTRGRTANHLFVTRGKDPLNGESLPRVPPPPVVDAVTERLRRSGPELAAIEIDPGAAEPSLRRRKADDIRRLGRLVRHEPPVPIVRVLGPRPVVPFLSSQWEHLAEMELHGQPGTETSARDLRTRFTIAAAREDWRAAGMDELPEWSFAHLSRCAASDRLRLPTAHLVQLYERIESHRQRHGVQFLAPDDEGPYLEALLGPRPPDPAAAASYDLLATQIVASTQPTLQTGRAL